MGKGWKKSGGGGGGGGAKGDLSSLRGSGCIIATCDVAREREATKELTNLLTQMIEELYPSNGAPEGPNSATTPLAASSSIESLLAEEIRQCSTKQKQPVHSVNSGIKGFVVVKVAQPHICPIHIVRSIFEKVRRTHLACSRHICRIVPLSKVFFANEAEFEINMKTLIAETFNLPLPVAVEPAEEVASTVSRGEDETTETQPLKKLKQGEESSVDVSATEETATPAPEDAKDSPLESPSSGKRSISEVKSTEPLLPVSMLLKKRNHNTLNRLQIQHIIFGNMPRSRCTVDFKNPKAVFIVELFMNTCGISFLEDIDQFEDLNLKKFQQVYCQTEDKKQSRVCPVVPAADAGNDQLEPEAEGGEIEEES